MTKKEIEPKFNITEDGVLSFLAPPPEEKEIIIPGTLGKTLAVLTKLEADQNMEISLKEDFRGLPLASFMAFNEAIEEMFVRTKALGEASFWGSSPPARMTIRTGPKTEARIYVGKMAPPAWKGGYIQMQINPKDHMSVTVLAYVKKKYEMSVRRLLNAAQAKARQKSMYHEGAWDIDLDYLASIAIGAGYDMIATAPKPIEDLEKTATLVLPRDIENRLIVNLWNVIERPNDYRANKVPVRNGVMLIGPPGTGKTLTIMHTINRAIKAGFTVFKLLTPQWFAQAYKIAQHHSPSVLIAEDSEKFLSLPGPELDNVLEVLDGSSSKYSEVIVLCTTNHPEMINRKVLREGRMGTTIEYRTLDAEAGARLIRVLAAGYLAPDVDLEIVGREVDTLSASNVDGAINYAKKLAIHKFGQDIKGKVTTQMLIDGAVLIKQDKGLYRTGEISQDSSDLAFVRAGNAAARGVRIPPEVWHVVAESVRGVKRSEKEAKARVPQDDNLIKDAADR